MDIRIAVPAIFACAVSAQGSAIDFAQACLDATTDAIVLNVAAHPDDEAARTMVMLRHKYGARTVTVYTTCGGGGQNAIGREIGSRLAAIRIRETLAAAEHTGTEVAWLGFEDFGYSKSREETVRFWGGEELLRARMDAVVDRVAPDLVLTNHGLLRGHGHHRASAWAIRAACRERALPLFERVFEGLAKIEFDAAEIDPVRGMSFARQAYRGWQEHATQGPWSGFPLAEAKSDKWAAVNQYAKELGDDPARRLPSVFDSKVFLDELARLGLEPQEIEDRLDSFASDRARAEHVAEARALLPPLRTVHASLSGDRSADRADATRLAAGRRLARRIDALERIVLIGAGIAFDAELVTKRVSRGRAAKVKGVLHGAGPLDAGLRVHGGDSVAFDGGVAEATFIAPARLPEGDPAAALTQSVRVQATANLVLDGMPFELRRTIEVPLGPALRVEWPRPAMFVPSGVAWERVMYLDVESFSSEPIEQSIHFRGPESITVEAIPATVSLLPENPRARVFVRVRGDGSTTGRFSLRVRVGDAQPPLLDVQPIAAAATEGLRVALVRGPDDTVERFLADLGIPFESLDETGLATADLSQFTTLLLDIRAYHHRPDLANHRSRIFEFNERGGRVFVSYHKPREWNESEGRPSLAPLELKVANQRVSEEDAAVEFIDPGHELLNRPFEIASTDFDGWVQERGLNFPDKWDPDWVPLLRMNDEGEKPLESSLLVLRNGGGEYVYCSLALYRQLRVGHLGAARLMINLLTP